MRRRITGGPTTSPLLPIPNVNPSELLWLDDQEILGVLLFRCPGEIEW
jgi:hypothetical protein